eukprot:CAMPEP_0119416680 /NCGR_PEP_ID=MMETSP1335-20130426/13721_1 /TAXON_ID=259385 /ORGANISM="Chrysoculter rhomboideus, Strain RCC1486" /LENGTH=87 /DNA_ID=CAMNT_0007441817 /DNA_START=82 /DNA_END=341 /DNA_ORIENTATION=-
MRRGASRLESSLAAAQYVRQRAAARAAPSASQAPPQRTAAPPPVRARGVLGAVLRGGAAWGAPLAPRLEQRGGDGALQLVLLRVRRR